MIYSWCPIWEGRAKWCTVIFRGLESREIAHEEKRERDCPKIASFSQILFINNATRKWYSSIPRLVGKLSHCIFSNISLWNIGTSFQSCSTIYRYICNETGIWWNNIKRKCSRIWYAFSSISSVIMSYSLRIAISFYYRRFQDDYVHRRIFRNFMVPILYYGKKHFFIWEKIWMFRQQYMVSAKASAYPQRYILCRTTCAIWIHLEIHLLTPWQTDNSDRLLRGCWEETSRKFNDYHYIQGDHKVWVFSYFNLKL